MRRAVIGALLAVAAASSMARDPDCTGPERWAARMAEIQLSHAGLLDTRQVDDAKTAIVRISSQKIGKDLYRQVHRIRFYYQSGQMVQAFTVNDASRTECSMGGVDVYPALNRVDEFGPELAPFPKK